MSSWLDLFDGATERRVGAVVESAHADMSSAAPASNRSFFTATSTDLTLPFAESVLNKRVHPRIS